MAVGNARVFPGFLTPVLTQLFFPKLPASAEVRGENTPERKVAPRGSNSKPPGHESDTLTTEPPGGGENRTKNVLKNDWRIRALVKPDYRKVLLTRSRKFKVAKSIGSYQPARTAQADMN